MKKNLEKEDRLVSIDFLRAIAIALVIIFHLLFEIYPNNSLRPIGFIGVSLFFIISGFLLAKKYSFLEKFSLKWFLKRYLKVASVYYLAIILIVILFGTLTYSGKLIDILLHFVFLDPFFKSSAYSIISPAWFITPLILFYLFFPYLNKLIKKNIFFLAIAFLIMGITRYYLGGLVNANPLFFLGEFCFGIAFANGKKYSALFLSLVTIFIMPLMFLPFIIFFVLYYIKPKYLPSKILNFIGINTFVLFLYHEAFIKVAFGKWHIFGLNMIYSLIILIVVVIISIFVSNKILNYFLKLKYFSK